jgi:hypothetical protein
MQLLLVLLLLFGHELLHLGQYLLLLTELYLFLRFNFLLLALLLLSICYSLKVVNFASCFRMQLESQL